VDAAIDRFRTLRRRSRVRHPVSLPWEAQEKKGLKNKPSKSYQRYLINPHDGDGDKIRKKSISFTKK